MNKYVKRMSAEIKRCGFSEPEYGVYDEKIDRVVPCVIPDKPTKMPEIIHLEANLGEAVTSISFSRDMLAIKRTRTHIIVELLKQVIELLGHDNE